MNELEQDAAKERERHRERNVLQRHKIDQNNRKLCHSKMEIFACSHSEYVRVMYRYFNAGMVTAPAS